MHWLIIIKCRHSSYLMRIMIILISFYNLSHCSISYNILSCLNWNMLLNSGRIANSWPTCGHWKIFVRLRPWRMHWFFVSLMGFFGIWRLCVNKSIIFYKALFGRESLNSAVWAECTKTHILLVLGVQKDLGRNTGTFGFWMVYARIVQNVVVFEVIMV